MTAQDVVSLIKGFTQRYPQSEFGPAHIVLSDYNLSDDHILWCISLCRAATSRSCEELSLEDIKMMNKLDWYDSHSDEELEATAKFLEDLLQIPENNRESGFDDDDEYL